MNDPVKIDSCERQGFWHRPTGIYASTAVILLNFALLFVVVNLCALPIVDHPAPRHAWLIEKWGLDRVARGYPGWKLRDLREFLYETSNWVFEFEPFTQFRPRPTHQRYINVLAAGFRVGAQQAPWPPLPAAVNVFFFGGSTTMGVGLPDDETIPSQFQNRARTCNANVAVYNFGRGYYFSTQERILFEQLLLQGHVPKVAIFIDGLNDSFYAKDEPEWTNLFRDLMAKADPHTGKVEDNPSWESVVRALPIARLIARIARGADHNSSIPDITVSDTSRQMAYKSPQPVTIAPDQSEEEVARSIIQRMQINRDMIGALGQRFGVKVLSVLQPVSTFGYDLRYMNVFNGDMSQFGHHIRDATVYAILEKDAPGRGNSLWLGDIQRERNQNLYVDQIHYTKAFSGEIAKRILGETIARGLITCH